MAVEVSSPAPVSDQGIAKLARDSLGRIPFTIRVGVTGHRKLDLAADGTAGLVAAALAKVKNLFPAPSSTELLLVAVSALAEGADRLVAQSILSTSGGSLEVALPLPIPDYVTDFEDEDSRSQFAALIKRASLVVAAPGVSDRTEAYERAGRYVVNRCDVLVALWDKLPTRGRGGTAEIVRYALESRVPVVLVPADGGPLVVDEGDGPLSEEFAAAAAARPPFSKKSKDDKLPIDVARASLAELARYNKPPQFLRLRSRALEASALPREIASETMYLPDGASVPDIPLNDVALWVRPFFVWADRRAIFFQKCHGRGIIFEFASAAAAVTVAALVTIFDPEAKYPRWLILEGIFVLLAIWIVRAGLRSHIHRQWLESRFLAERFRAAIFLKLAGIGASNEGGFEGVNLADQTEDWLRRAFKYVWDQHPTAKVDPEQLESLRTLLAEGWVESQIRYHRDKSDYHRRIHHRILRASLVGVILTIAMVVVHNLPLESIAEVNNLGLEPRLVEHIASLLSIVIPAVGSAIGGIAAQRQYHRHATVYARMARYLTSAKLRIAGATTLAELQRAATNVDDIMGDENRDWLGVMKFHDFEIAG
jgi:hypothetical protein